MSMSPHAVHAMKLVLGRLKQGADDDGITDGMCALLADKLEVAVNEALRGGESGDTSHLPPEIAKVFVGTGRLVMFEVESDEEPRNFVIARSVVEAAFLYAGQYGLDCVVREGFEAKPVKTYRSVKAIVEFDPEESSLSVEHMTEGEAEGTWEVEATVGAWIDYYQRPVVLETQVKQAAFA